MEMLARPRAAERDVCKCGKKDFRPGCVDDVMIYAVPSELCICPVTVYGTVYMAQYSSGLLLFTLRLVP